MRTVTDIYVELAERIAARLGRPRVRALHLPRQRAQPSIEAEFCALELEDGAFGFSFLLLGDTERLLRARYGAADLAGTDAAALARGYAESDPAAKALGFAAINALSPLLFTRAGWNPRPAEDSLGELAPAGDEHIGMIGLFRPLLKYVRTSGARLTVLELRQELAGEHDGYRVTTDPRELVSCEKVLSTCTVLLNDTLDGLLAACSGASRFAIVGPTAGCVPDPLFARGVHSVNGRRVSDAQGFREAIVNGDKWGSFAYKYAIAKDDYPGIEQLLRQADRAGGR